MKGGADVPEYSSSVENIGKASARLSLFSETVWRVSVTADNFTANPSEKKKLVASVYKFAFDNIHRLEYPEVFPVWLDRLSVFLSFASVPLNWLNKMENRKKTVAFLRGFHSMSDEEIAALLKMNTAEVAEIEGTDRGDSAPVITADDVREIWSLINAVEQKTEIPVKTVTQRVPQNRKRKKKFPVFKTVFAAACLGILALVAFLCLRAPKKNPTKRDELIEAYADAISLQLAGEVGEIYQLSENMYYISVNLGMGGEKGLVVCYDVARNSLRMESPNDGVLTEAELLGLAENRYMQVLYDPINTESGGSASQAVAEAEGNSLTLGSGTVSQMISGTESLSAEADFSIMLRVNCRNVDLTRPMTIVLDSDISRLLGEAGGLQIVLNDLQHCIELSRQQLTGLCTAYDSVTLSFYASEPRKYEIAFYSDKGDKLTELFGTMTFTLPAEGQLTYVFATYDQGSESRGGVYDKETGTITFPVSLSGTYELIGSEVEIADIAELDPATAAAARFLVSLRFAGLDENGNFRADDTITRGELVNSIGRMFLATSIGQTSDFTDVDMSDPAYEYISSGATSSILTGYGDGAFHAEADASREEVLTICGRTLIYRFGMNVPDDPEYLLGFDDADELSEYAREAIAVMADNGIIDSNGLLMPGRAAKRGETAVLLYRMYCLLYGYHSDE